MRINNWIITMAVCGFLSQFNTTDGVRDTYSEQLAFGYKQLAKLMPLQRMLFSCGDSCWRFLRNLIAPAKPKDKSLDELIAVLQEYFSPTSSVTLKQFKFSTTVRSQLISSNVAHLIVL